MLNIEWFGGLLWIGGLIGVCCGWVIVGVCLVVVVIGWVCVGICGVGVLVIGGFMLL